MSCFIYKPPFLSCPLVPFLSFLIYFSACQSYGNDITENDKGEKTGEEIKEEKPNYELIWEDNFTEGSLPNEDRWVFDVGGHGFGNQELQYYTNKRTKNVRLEDGKLIIEAHKESFEGNAYTSGKIWTKGKGSWKYGRFEASMKLPKGKGTWPAFWMLPDKEGWKWPLDGEIDIMEHVGFDPGVVHGTIHTQAYHHSIGTQKGKQINVPNAMDGFHVYAIEWSPQKIDWFVDGQKYYTLYKEDSYEAWPFDENHYYLILNLAVGGSWGGSQGVDDNIWPQKLVVDYVRVYKEE